VGIDTHIRWKNHLRLVRRLPLDGFESYPSHVFFRCGQFQKPLQSQYQVQGRLESQQMQWFGPTAATYTTSTSPAQIVMHSLAVQTVLGDTVGRPYKSDLPWYLRRMA